MPEDNLIAAPFYDASVPIFRQQLGVLAELLRKGETHARERGADPESILEARLAPDMLTLMGQVQRASDHAKGAAARPSGYEPPPYVDRERGLTEAHARIARTLKYLETFSPEMFVGAQERIITLPFNSMKLCAIRYLYSVALPSFFFHVTTGYAILRHIGVPIGKADFIGNILNLKS